MSQSRHPRNPWISNGRLAEWYLWSLRHRVRIVRKIIGLLLNTDIDCPVPDRLFLPHPFGIIVGTTSKMANDVTLMHQVTLGGKDPWCTDTDLSDDYPTLEEGVYVGAGAKILGPVTIGKWAIVGANAVITKNVPPGATAVGFNVILRGKDKGG
jgi:serine O-acetyltransferase